MTRYTDVRFWRRRRNGTGNRSNTRRLIRNRVMDGRRRRISGKADPHPDAVFRRQRHRSPRAPARREVERGVGPARRGRQSHRRGGQHRRRDRGESDTRRLHAARRRNRPNRHQSAARQEPCVRRPARIHADHAYSHQYSAPDRAAVAACQIRARTDRAGPRKTGTVALWFARHRQLAASRRNC